MRVKVLRRHAWWLLPLLAAALVALIGTRLVALGVHERAEQLRRAAQAAVLRHAQLIEAELAALAVAAQRELGGATGGTRSSPGVSQTTAAAPERGTFSMSADGAVLAAAPTDGAIANAIAAEWAPHLQRAAPLSCLSRSATAVDGSW